MFSLQNRIRIYIVVSILIYIVFAISIFIIDTYLHGALTSEVAKYAEIITFLNQVYIMTIILSITAVLMGIYIFVSTHIRGLNKYRELYRRLGSIQERGDFNLGSIAFPEEDEFGNVGSELNKIVAKMAVFDDLKIQRLKAERQKVEILVNRITVPVLVISVERGEKMVKMYNKKFQAIFAKKPGDNIFYDIKNTILSALHIHDDRKMENQPDKMDGLKEQSMSYFIDKEFVQAIDVATTTLAATTIKKDITTLDGLEVYHSDAIEILPIWNDYGKAMDILIIFERLKKK